MQQKKSIKQDKFYIKGKEEIKDLDAPVVSDEFLDKRQPEGDYHGQTIEVRSKTKLEEDLGTGEAVIMRSYVFASNPQLFLNGRPDSQEIFQSHMKGIQSMLWADGLSPAVEIEPRLIFAPDNKTYLIMVWARPSIGQAVIENTRTLTEIIHEGKQGGKDRNEIQRGVSVPTTKKKATKRATKAPK